MDCLNPSEIDDQLSSASENLTEENNLNLITKFRNQNLKKHKERQKIKTKLYIRDQLSNVENGNDRKIEDHLRAKREKRRLLGIAMGTEPLPDRSIKQATLKNEDKKNEGGYSKVIAKEIEDNNELQVLYNIIKNSEGVNKPKKRSKKFVMNIGEKSENNGIKFDFEKIKELYNVSLLENGMMTQKQIFEKRKTDAK